MVIESKGKPTDMQTLKQHFPTVSFGTSGVRALVTDLSNEVLAAYTQAFILRLQALGQLTAGTSIKLGIDLRPSSPAIALAIVRTLRQMAVEVEYLGALPTPALALRCLQTASPGIMVTGSHIPFDRNGIKFYLPDGEILKADEAAIVGTLIDPASLVLSGTKCDLPPVDSRAREAYEQRYLSYFGASALQGLRLGVFEHSAVGRDLIGAILGSLGATVFPLGRSDAFVPIDTEAVSEADQAQARRWSREHRLDALVSTDGDGDRPLVFDAEGNFVRGDLLGLICARTLQLKRLALPVSCNTAIERSDVFTQVLRTRIGSPYVIAGMNELSVADSSPVGGFEANGGFMLGSAVPGLAAVPTRDAMLPMIALLATAVQQKKTVAELLAELPERFTHSDRLRDVPSAASQSLLIGLLHDEALKLDVFGREVVRSDTTDGMRVYFANEDILHLRASGNAPELRCYAESASYRQAQLLCTDCLERCSAILAEQAGKGE